MKTFILTGTLALTAAVGAAIAPNPAAAQGFFGGNFDGVAGALKHGQCIGACVGIVHRAVPVGRAGTVTPTRTPVHVMVVPAPQPLRVPPPPGQGATAGRVGTFAPPPPPGRH
jgi:hypothetical protein